MQMGSGGYFTGHNSGPQPGAAGGMTPPPKRTTAFWLPFGASAASLLRPSVRRPKIFQTRRM
ncbi:MAG: hypothetical protein K6T83_16070 [Alicyclobacillus sp.]|nr:hypothetical protein [Alicyclobacillus sp.]